MTLPRVLWITAFLGAELNAGGEIRTARLIRELAKSARIELVVLGARSSEEAIRQATQCAEVHVFARSPSALRKRARALSRLWPLPVAAWWDPEASALVRRQTLRSDVVVLDQLWVAGFSVVGPRVILSLHNAEALRLSETSPPRSWLRRAERSWNVWATRRLEKVAIERATATVTVCSGDATALGVLCQVVPNGADIPAAPAPGPRARGGLVLFVGSMDYAPNERAVRWWVSEVWPRLGNSVPPLTVIGRQGMEVLRDLLGHEGLTVRGAVQDVGPYLHDAAVVVVPLQDGGGTRLKVMEALAWRRPVVSTAKGAEGVPVENRIHALIEDGPAEFAAAVMELYHDDELAEALSERGRVLAEQFAWEAVAVPFVATVLGRGHRAELR